MDLHRILSSVAGKGALALSRLKDSLGRQFSRMRPVNAKKAERKHDRMVSHHKRLEEREGRLPKYKMHNYGWPRRESAAERMVLESNERRMGGEKKHT